MKGAVAHAAPGAIPAVIARDVLVAKLPGEYLPSRSRALGISLVVASASWYLVERPVLRLKDRPLFGRDRLPPSDAPPSDLIVPSA